MAEGRPFLPVRKLVLFIPSDFKGWRQRSLLFSSRQEINMGIRNTAAKTGQLPIQPAEVGKLTEPLRRDPAFLIFPAAPIVDGIIRQKITLPSK